MRADPAERLPLGLYLLLAAGSALLVSGWIRYAGDAWYFLTNDSFGYIEEATNFLAGRGLVRAPEALNSSAQYVPWPSYPPGYPICIAALGLLGLDPTSAALAISRVSWALLPAALVWATRPLIPLAPGLALAAVVATSPAMFQWGSRAMADVPSLVLTILAFGAVLRGLQEGPRPFWLAVSGMALAANYPLRNASVASIVALAIALGLAAALRLYSMRTLLRAGLIVGLSALPLLALVSARNLTVFGSIQPFAQRFAGQDLPTFSLRNALGENVWGLLMDATGSRLMASLAWDGLLLSVAGLSLAGVVGYCLAKTWAAMPAVRRFGVLWLITFCAVGTVMVTLARMRGYAVDDYRYMAQHTWAALLVLAIGWDAWFGSARRAAGGVALAAALALVVAHMNFIVGETARSRTIAGLLRAAPELETAARDIHARGWPQSGWLVSDAMRAWFAADPELRSALAGLPEDAVVLAAWPYQWFLSHETRRRVRGIDIDRYREGLELLRKSGSANAGRPVYLVVLPPFSMLLANHPQGWQQFVVELLRSDFAPVRREKNFVLARAQPQGS